MNEQEKNQNTWKRARRILEIANAMVQGTDGQARWRIEEIQLYSGYSEPGYYSASGIVATGNWNKITGLAPRNGTDQNIMHLPDRIYSIFEKMGIDCEWYDEWALCSECNKLVRTQADSYCWMRSYAEYNGEISCIECLKKDPEGYLSSLEDNPDTANTMESIDPCKHGYVKVNEDSYENGWYPGQNDQRSKIAKELREKGISRFLFGVDIVGQFETKFSVYVHQEEEHLLNAIASPIYVMDDEEEEYFAPDCCDNCDLNKCDTCANGPTNGGLLTVSGGRLNGCDSPSSDDCDGSSDLKGAINILKGLAKELNECDSPSSDDCDENCDKCDDTDYCHNPATVVKHVPAPKKEVPCKFCKTNLWENEEYCWKCGTKDPIMISKSTA